MWRLWMVAALVSCAAAAAPSNIPKPILPGSVPLSRRVWQSADGLPEDFAQALAQTPDGYLWIGSSGGLVRFDGTRFTVFSSQNEPAFRDDSVYSLLTARDGTLWAGTEGGGLIRYREGSFRQFGAAEGLTNGFVRVIFEDRDGRIWVGTDHGLFRLDNGRLVRVDGRGAVPAVAVHSIAQDRAGRLLVGGSGLLILTGEEAAYYRSSENLADNSIRTIRQTGDGTVWIGTISGLRRLEHGITGDPFAAPKIIRDTNLDFLAESRSGELWIGTYGQGLLRYRNGQFVRFTAPSTLPNNNVLAIFEDAEEDIWVGTQGGLLRLSPTAAATLTTADGAPQSINTIYQDPHGKLFATALNGRLFEIAHQALEPVRLPGRLNSVPVRNVFRDSRGALWMGTDGQGAIRVAGAEERQFTMKQGLVNDFVRAFAEGADGSIWIGTDGGLSRWRGGTFQNFGIGDGLAYGSIRALLADGDGNLWVATDGGLSRLREGVFVSDPLVGRLRGQKVWALYRDAQGSLWIGTHGSGLFLWNAGQVSRFTTKDGLPTPKIHYIAEGPAGNLWMSGAGGIFAVSRKGLEELAADRTKQLAVRVYGTSDGLSTNQMNGGVQPAGAFSPSGEFWFPSTKGVVRIKPDAPIQRGAPPVLIEQVLADDQPAPVRGEVRAGPGAGKIEVHYTAVRLRSPEHTRFKYWMEGFDPEWTDAGQRRIAYYTNLPAGDYRFHVVAYELNDPRHPSEQVVQIRWKPHFYQTAWFVGICVVFAGGGAWGAYRLHLRNLRKRFTAVLEERNRLAREMHDTLIQGCAGVSALLEAASTAREISPQISNELLNRAREEVRAAVDEARMAVWNLRQASSHNPVEALSQLTARMGVETGIPVRFETAGPAFAMSGDAVQGLSMLIREALHNAVRHAAPKELAVRLDFGRRAVDVVVEDDGRGFDPANTAAVDGHHYGLIGMKERVAELGGELKIESVPGRGTKVRLRVPAAGRARAPELPGNAVRARSGG